MLENWEHILGNATTRDTGFIALEHDLFQQSVEVATGYILPDALAHNPPFNIQPVVACLNKPLTDAYIETNNNKTNPPAASGICVQWPDSVPLLKHLSLPQDLLLPCLLEHLVPHKQQAVLIGAIRTLVSPTRVIL